MHHSSSRSDKFLRLLGQTSPFPLLLDIDHAKGSYIYTKDGKKYLDMIAGVAVNNVGHNHPKVIEAIKKQADQYLHVMVYGEFIQDEPLAFAEELIAELPDPLNAVYTVNSGTEANEAALKLAKRITRRKEIIACRGAYHGSTHGSLSVSSNEAKKKPFEPLLPNIQFIKHNEVSDLDLITDKTAAVIIEPIQGDAGVRIPSIAYMKALRKKCNETGAQLIFDEIQCGMGRTGKLFAFEHFDVVPDILTLGKALGGGLPIGAFVSAREKMIQLSENPILGHITTFGGNPVICASARASLAVLKSIDYRKVEEIGQFIEEQLSSHRGVLEVRRIGLMFAIDMESDQIVTEVVQQCLRGGLISFWFLSNPDSFRLSPPLTLSMTEAEEAVAIILSAMDYAINK